MATSQETTILLLSSDKTNEAERGENELTTLLSKVKDTSASQTLAYN